MKKRAVTYARVSGDDTRKEGRNLQGQLELYQGYCQENGYQVMAELSEDDKGASGASWDLPELNKALDMAREGQFDILVTRELDRFARGLAKQLVIEAEFKRYGVEVEYVLEQYDDTPEGQLTKNIRAVIAEYEREKTNQRMIRGRRQKVKAGHIMTHGNPPFGYRIDRNNGKTALAICEQEAVVVRKVFELYTGNDEPTITEVTKRMEGTPSCSDLRKSNRNPKIRKRGQWSIGSVSNILDNETYTGVWCYAGDSALTVEIPAIISQEVWEKAQERKKHNASLSKRRTKYDYLMAKRLWCGQCNSKLVGRSKKGNGKLYLYYICQAKYRFARKCTMSIHFRADQVDTAIWDWLRDLFLDPNTLRQKLKKAQEERNEANRPLQDRLTVIDDLLAQNHRQLDKLLDLYLDDEFDKETLVDRKTRLETTIASLEKERADLEATLEALTLDDSQIKTVEDFARKVSEGLAVADQDFDARRELVKILDVKGTLTVENGQKVIYATCLIGDTDLHIENTSFCSR